jgi:transcriptional regulator with XRE-family HTH domain
MANRTKRTPEKRRRILDAISQGLTIAEAARAAGMVRNTIAEWRRDDAEFSAAFEAAYADGTDVWEQEGRRRAWDGDTALFIFLLKARDPQRFNRKMLAIGGDVDNPLIVHQGTDGDVVHFYMPPNGRDVPEPDELPATIEGTVEDTDTDVADEDKPRWRRGTY